MNDDDEDNKRRIEYCLSSIAERVGSMRESMLRLKGGSLSEAATEAALMKRIIGRWAGEWK